MPPRDARPRIADGRWMRFATPVVCLYLVRVSRIVSLTGLRRTTPADTLLFDLSDFSAPPLGAVPTGQPILRQENNQKMTEFIRRVRPRRLLLIAGLMAACATAGAIAVPALATNEYYECGSCEWVNGKENYIKNTFAINHSGGGICGVVWRNNGGGNYTDVAAGCASGGGTAKACASSEVYGHGEASSIEFGGWLRGRQDNFAACE
jgi:hypothetical protein